MTFLCFFFFVYIFKFVIKVNLILLVAKAAKSFGMTVYGMGRRETISEEKAGPVDKYM